MEWPVVPFVVRGVLVDLEAHVLRGACPMAGAVPPGKEPVRRRERQAFGTLVGFWTREAPGALTHAGQSLHTHVVLRGGESFSGHVERVRIAPGATLLLPRPTKYVTEEMVRGGQH